MNSDIAHLLCAHLNDVDKNTLLSTCQEYYILKKYVWFDEPVDIQLVCKLPYYDSFTNITIKYVHFIKSGPNLFSFPGKNYSWYICNQNDLVLPTKIRNLTYYNCKNIPLIPSTVESLSLMDCGDLDLKLVPENLTSLAITNQHRLPTIIDRLKNLRKLVCHNCIIYTGDNLCPNNIEYLEWGNDRFYYLDLSHFPNIQYLALKSEININFANRFVKVLELDRGAFFRFEDYSTSVEKIIIRDLKVKFYDSNGHYIELYERYLNYNDNQLPTNCTIREIVFPKKFYTGFASRIIPASVKKCTFYDRNYIDTLPDTVEEVVMIDDD